MLRMIFPLLLALALPLQAQEDLSEEVVTGRADEDTVTETGWLHLVKGSRGDVMGAEVREVREDTGEGRQLVIAIPKIEMEDPATIEEVRVVAQAPDGGKPVINFEQLEFRWLEDLDGDNYGLLIYYNEDTSMPIRLYMHSRHGTIR